ncbi:hypothetical protein LOAG_17923 [Loa loa]|uniref:Uncharacterized protein n=1 Tax=Loa loa TaxID=7209 RepID=A0A1S0UGZ6_LOALO|nr:hypothetical protein LOAG_17923 [Loa loa]EJD74813.1 hypothetical protein LOAG_17923 [Loa loa]
MFAPNRRSIIPQVTNSAQRSSITHTPVGGRGPPRTGYSSLRSSRRYIPCWSHDSFYK